ncbi:MAG: rhomboid family intramembrane serine protease [Dehalococcoidia bacterium]
MIPVGDSVRSRTFPYVNVALIAINVLVFLYELTLNATPLAFGGLSDLDRFFFEWATMPACLGDHFGFTPNVDARDLAAYCGVQKNVALTPLSAMFIHGGWLHLLGNMIFLWVFGDNVEDAMGHVRYAVFYAVVGLAAGTAHIFVNQNDLTPAIGASGAIAGVLGAYLVLYPRARVSAILPIFLFFWLPFQVPAVVLIGFWFLMQVFSGVANLAATDVVNAGGGVAWFAHIGGFAAGVLLVKLFVLGRDVPPPRSAIQRSRRW